VDGSGYNLTVTGSAVNLLVASDGTIINPQTGATTLHDSNGNEITSSTSSGTTTYTDTLGTTALAVAGSGTPSNPITLTYTAPAGGTHYQVNYINYTVATNFGVSGISEYKSACSAPL